MDTLDWKKLAGDVVPETGKIPYEQNKHLFKKVAFDVFQLNSSPVESLWTLEDGDDGEQFLVARYNDLEPDTLQIKSNWAALSDRDGKNVTLMYKDSPIQRFASSDYGFDSNDVHVFQKTLVEKLDSSELFVSKLLKSQAKRKLSLLFSQFPELQVLAAERPDTKDDEPSDWEKKNDPYHRERQNYEEDLKKGYEVELGPDWPNLTVGPAQEETDLEDSKIEAMHMAARAINTIDKFDRFSKQDIQEVLNSLAEELDAV